MGFLEDIGKQIGTAVDFVLSDLILARDVSSFDPAVGREATQLTNYPCRGLITDWTVFERAMMRVADAERRFLIRRSSLSIEPKVGDTIKAEGKEFTVTRVTIDPAKAMWDLGAT